MCFPLIEDRESAGIPDMFDAFYRISHNFYSPDLVVRYPCLKSSVCLMLLSRFQFLVGDWALARVSVPAWVWVQVQVWDWVRFLVWVLVWLRVRVWVTVLVWVGLAFGFYGLFNHLNQNAKARVLTYGCDGAKCVACMS